MADFTPLQLGLGAAAAFVVGFSKSGLPGSGILAVPLMAMVFVDTRSVGATLPLLIVGDICALGYHRQNAEWIHLRKLAPAVLLGLLIGTLVFVLMSRQHLQKGWINPTVGAIVLLMLGLSLTRGRLGDKLTPTSPVGTASTGVIAGLTTMLANAAGPVMAIYMTATGMAKKSLMGTTVWSFFIFNLVKVPLQAVVTHLAPNSAMIDRSTLTFDALAAPVVVMGAVAGKRVFDRLPQELFTKLVLVLAAIASLKLLWS